MSVKRRRRKARARKPVSVPEPISVGVTEGSAPLDPDPLPPAEAATPADLPEHGETGSPENSAADAAEAAATGTDSAEPIEGGEAGPNLDPFGAALTPSSLVQLCDVALFVAVRAACSVKRVPFDAEVQRLAKLTKQERSDLEAMAPLAVPYLSRQFAKAPDWAGAAMFGAMFASVAGSHVSAAVARHVEPEPASE